MIAHLRLIRVVFQYKKSMKKNLQGGRTFEKNGLVPSNGPFINVGDLLKKCNHIDSASWCYIGKLNAVLS